MAFFKDVISSDLLLSDAFPRREIADGCVWEVPAKYISLPGEEESIQVIDLVHAHKLEEAAGYDKKGFMYQLKEYTSAIKAYLQKHNPDRVAIFQQGGYEFTKNVLAGFDNYTLFTGESLDSKAMIVVCKPLDDGSYLFYYWRDGLKEELE